MARAKHPAEENPTLPPDKAIHALETLITQAAEVAKEDRRSPAATEWASTAESALTATLGSSHNLVHSFKREFHSGVYYPHDSEQRRQQQFQQQVSGATAVLKTAVNHLRWQ